ncbi:MAG: tetratricopeptide repeat protein [candidate division WOR-3 bacterium]
MNFEFQSLKESIATTLRSGIYSIEKLGSALGLDQPFVENFFKIVVPAATAGQPLFLGTIWLVYSFFEQCKKSKISLEQKNLDQLKQEFEQYTQDYNKLTEKWKSYITACGLKPLTSVLSTIDRSRAETDKQQFCSGFKPTWNVIIDNFDIRRELKDEILDTIKKGKNILLLGNSGSGKSVLMMRLAYDLFQQEYCPFISDGIIDAQKALHYLQEPEFNGQKKLVFIDNVALYKDEVVSLINNIHTQSLDIPLILVEQTAAWEAKVRENLAPYNFEKFELQLTESEARDYIKRFGGKPEMVALAQGVFPMLVMFVSTGKASFDKAVDDFWNLLTSQQQELMTPLLIVNRYGLDYPEDIFTELYDNEVNLAELERKRVISRSQNRISTWHPFISRKIITDRLRLSNQTIRNHLEKIAKASNLNSSHTDFLFSLATAVLIEHSSGPVKDKNLVDAEIQMLTRAIELKPDDPKAYNNRGLAYYQKGELDKAIPDFSKTIELKPDLAEAYNNRGLAYYLKGELDKAIPDSSKAIELKPDYAEAYFNRGLAYAEQGELDKAIPDYSKTIELKPDLAEAYYNRGLAYAEQGELDKAIQDWSMAMRLKPELLPEDIKRFLQGDNPPGDALMTYQ